MMEWLQLTEAELQALWLSIKVASLCSLLSLPFALWVGYKMARSTFWGKPVIESLIQLPLVMPPVTTGFLLLLCLGSNSYIGSFIYTLTGIQLSFSFYAAVIASMVVSFPLIVRSIRTSMEMIDTGLEDAAKVLGANTWNTFTKVTIPLALPGIVAGIILAFARSLGEFGATISFAGNIEGETQTLPLAIYTNMQIPGKEDSAMKLVIISVIISFVAMILSEWYIKRMKHARS